MSALLPFAEGGFAFLEGGFPYSQGVVSLPGFAIERMRFARPVPVTEGFRKISDFLDSQKRKKTTLCAVELRSPSPFTFAAFAEFNKGYVAVLEQWGLYRGGKNPLARSNVAPEVAPPAEPCFYAFSYTVPAPGAPPSFVVAGSGEWPEGGRFPEDIVARGDTSESGMRAKTAFVLDKMDSRMNGLGVGWDQATVSQLYTVQNIQKQIERIQRHVQPSSLTWHYCRPPIEGLDYEMDVRGVGVERALPEFP